MESNSLNCYSCNSKIVLPPGPVSRSEVCSKCNADLRVCKNCAFYDSKSYNECREPSAERVVDKEKSNFCDYFTPGNNSAATTTKADALKKLDDLFK